MAWGARAREGKLPLISRAVQSSRNENESESENGNGCHVHFHKRICDTPRITPARGPARHVYLVVKCTLPICIKSLRLMQSVDMELCS